MTNAMLDKATGLVLMFLGLVVTFGAWQMPRFENQGAMIYQAPGLTPGLLGLGLAFCGLLLAIRPAGEAGSEKSFWSGVMGSSQNRRRALAALVMTIGFGGFLFGNVPFVIATFVFVFAFIVTFEYFLLVEGKTRPKAFHVMLIAGALAAVTSFLSQFVFETLFLIRLP